jgi:ribosomal protein L37AE/L43A
MLKELKILLQKYFGISSPKPLKIKKDITEKRIKRLSIKTEIIVNGHCPMCQRSTLFVSIAPPFYRCMHCGYDLEQRINGAIQYIPISSSGSEHRIVLDDGSE